MKSFFLFDNILDKSSVHNNWNVYAIADLKTLFNSTVTHWGRATHICVSKLTIITSDNGLSPGRCQAIIWSNAGILSIGLLGTKFSEILVEIMTFSFTKMRINVSSAKWRPFCLRLNVLKSTFQESCTFMFSDIFFFFFVLWYKSIFRYLSGLRP